MSYHSGQKPIFENKINFPTGDNRSEISSTLVLTHDIQEKKQLLVQPCQIEEKLLEMSSKMEKMQIYIEKLEKKIFDKLKFLKLIEKSLECLNLLNQIEFYQTKNNSQHYLESTNNINDKLMFFWRYHQPTIFNKSEQMNILSEHDEDRVLELQDTDPYLCSFSVCISSLGSDCTFQKFSNRTHWSVIRIQTDPGWTDNIKSFSVTPYLKIEGKSIHNNQCLSSEYIKLLQPSIFSTKNEIIQIFFTFDNFFARLLNDPKQSRYVFVLPFYEEHPSVSIILRFEKYKINSKLNLKNYVNVHSFSNLPYFLSDLSETNTLDTETELKLVKKASICYTDYEKNKEDIDSFLLLASEYKKKIIPIKIYPYDKDPYYTYKSKDIMFPELNKSMYITERIQLRERPLGKLLIPSCIILAINHVKNGISSENKIHLHDIGKKVTIDTWTTSNSLGALSRSMQKDEQEIGLFRKEIDFSKYDPEITEVIFIEKIQYPVSYLEKDDDDDNYYFQNQYVSFDFNPSYETDNSSLSDKVDVVKSGTSYNIKTNDPEFSLHANFSKYSTLNFRAYKN
jgi:hypothetical protein